MVKFSESGIRVASILLLGVAAACQTESISTPQPPAFVKGPLFKAVSDRRADDVRILLARGADPNAFEVNPPGTEDGGATLLKSGARVDARMGLDGTLPGALFYSVKENQQAAVNLLLVEGAIVQRRDVLQAVENGNAALVAQLLAAGGDPYWRFSTDFVYVGTCRYQSIVFFRPASSDTDGS